ncbi:15360_t:CDS:2, partial [Acaulospora morrowiae]
NDAIASESLPETETRVSISTESHVSDSSKAKVNVVTKKVSPENQISVSASPPHENKTLPPISVLPDDPQEKQKHVIEMSLEWFPVLSLKYKGLWGSGDYVNTSTLPQMLGK